MIRTTVLTCVVLSCFAANSLLCRLALAPQLIDPAAFTTVRVLSATAVLMVMVWLRRSLRTTRPRINPLSVASLAAYLVCFSFAYVRLEAGSGALVLFASVQLTMFSVALREGERFSPLAWAGLAVAFMGFVWLVLPGLSAPDPVGTLLMTISGVAWGSFSLLARGETDPVEANAFNFLCCVPLVLGISLYDAAGFHLEPMGGMLAMLSGAIASGGGYVLWYRLLRRLSAAKAATVQLAVPAIASLGGILFLSEPITSRLLVGSAAILGGLAIVLSHRRPTAAPARN